MGSPSLPFLLSHIHPHLSCLYLSFPTLHTLTKLLSRMFHSQASKGSQDLISLRKCVYLLRGVTAALILVTELHVERQQAADGFCRRLVGYSDYLIPAAAAGLMAYRSWSRGSSANRAPADESS